MAYSGGNNIKTIDEIITQATSGMIKNSGDQTIDGNKEFLKPIRGSGFYDTQAAKMFSHPAIVSIHNDTPGALLISNGDGTATASSNLIFNGDSLKASSYFGSGIGLTNLQATQVVGKLSLDNINYGGGLIAQNNELHISVGEGVEIRNTGVSFKSTTHGGLYCDRNGVRVDPSSAIEKYTMSTNDRFLISDSDNNNEVRNVTVDKLSQYLQNTLRFAKPKGQDGHIQFKNRGLFNSSNSFVFRNDTLSVVNLSLDGQLQIGNTFIKKDRFIVSMPKRPVENVTLPNNTLTLYVDEDSDKLMLKVKYSTGVVRNISIDLIKRALVQEEDDETENQGFLLDDEIFDDEIGTEIASQAENLPEESFAEVESTQLAESKPSSGGILGYFKSAFTKK